MDKVIEALTNALMVAIDGGEKHWHQDRFTAEENAAINAVSQNAAWAIAAIVKQARQDRSDLASRASNRVYAEQEKTCK